MSDLSQFYIEHPDLGEHAEVSPSDIASMAISHAIDGLGSSVKTWDDWKKELGLPLKDKHELRAWIIKYLGISIPNKSCCDEHTPPMDAFAEAYFAEVPRSVWYASRGFGGKSVLLATLSLVEAITLGAQITLLGGSGEQSQRVLQYMSGDDTNLPDSFWGASLAPLGLLKSDLTKKVSVLRNGGAINALMASQKSVRGPHPQRLRGDEIDEMDKAIWDAAQGQPMEARGILEQTVGSSTWQNPNGTMLAEMMEAKANGWPVRIWCYKCNLEENGGWLSQGMVDRKRASLPAYMFNIEYDLQEPSIEGRLIDPIAVEGMFDKSMGEYKGEMGAQYEFEGPVDGAEYCAGADWAKSRDRTILTMLRTDVMPFRVVAWAHLGRMSFPKMISVFNIMCERYEAYAVHDATGLGSVVDDYLEMDSMAFKLVGKRRERLFSEYVATIENGEIKCPMIEYMHAEHAFCVVDDIFGTGHPPDTIVSGALANWLAGAPDLLY